MPVINICFLVLQPGNRDNNFLLFSHSGDAVGEVLLPRHTENKPLKRKGK